MEVKKERIAAYFLGVILLVIGIVSYAAFPERPPEEPVRILLPSSAGKVLFDMKQHTAENGYGYECTDCHHDIDDPEEETPEPCRVCHLKDKDESEAEINTEDAFHTQCIDCHELDGTAPADCDKCHYMG